MKKLVMVSDVIKKLEFVCRLGVLKIVKSIIKLLKIVIVFKIEFIMYIGNKLDEYLVFLLYI